MKPSTPRALAILIAAITCHSQLVLGGDCAILLHGLARTDSSLEKLSETLDAEGYEVINVSYPSRDARIDALAEAAIPQAIEQCQTAAGFSADNRIHFVTHSMGGILVRHYFSTHTLANLGRVVMLAPPNKGSEVVDKLKDVPGFEAINGPAGMQLGTDEQSVPNQLGAANFTVGIIAGTRTINPLLSTLLPNPDDGKVSVANTKLAGMTDHISLPVTHPMMMNNDQVIAQTLYFLAEGRFDRPQSTAKNSP